MQRPLVADFATFGLDPSWSRTIDVPSHDGATHRWHFLDRPGTQKDAPVVLCLHGNPTWSFLWSRLFNELNSNFRVIALDHLSMGLSERVPTRTYRDRVADINDVVTALNIAAPVWIVAQDWGGAIGMGYAVAHPERVAGMVLSNTGIAIPHNRRAPLLIRLAAATGIHRLVTKDSSLFVRGTPFLPGRGIS
ncbi:MAG: alpha/beta fold hydrolase, partial [Ilumatobacteraceae bacterium]|nr:alpha/beta fold hydrolase [Ilumatobacteraceae bacterium]